MRQKRAQKVSKENQGYVAPNEERREFFLKKKKRKWSAVANATEK